MKHLSRIDYPTIELLEAEVERRQAWSRRREQLKSLLLLILAGLWAWVVLR